MTTHLKPRSATVVLYQGDDMDTLAELRRRVDLAERQAEQRSGTERAGDDDMSVSEAKNAFDAFVDAAAERALEVEIRSIGRRRFRDLVLEHPPRMVDAEPDADGKVVQVEHEDDQGYGVNVDTFARALLTYRDGEHVTIAHPEFPSKAAVEAFVDDELAEGDFDKAWTGAFFLNRAPSADPKMLAYGTVSPSGSEI